MGADGRHPDGSLHVDHYHLIAAIQGKLRDPNDPTNPDAGRSLPPGRIKLAVEVHQVLSDAPVALADLNADQRTALADNAYIVEADAAGKVIVSDGSSFDCGALDSAAVLVDATVSTVVEPVVKVTNSLGSGLTRSLSTTTSKLLRDR